MKARRLAATALLLTLRTVDAHADPPRDGAHEGLMIRGALGFGYLALRGDGTPLQASGGSYVTHVAAGWYVVPNLAVHATIWNHSAFNPTGTSALGAATESRLNTPSVGGLGLGVTWVFARAQVFVSASAGLSSLSMETSASDIVVVSRADPGYAFDVMVGRQFGGGTSGWRFGVALEGSLHRNGVTARGAFDDVTTGAVGLAATITYH